MTLDQQTGLYGAYDFIYEPFFTKPWFIVFVALIGVISITLLGFFIYRIIKHSKKRHETPFVQAQRKLQELSKSFANNDNSVSSTSFEEIIFILKQYWQQKTKQEIMQYTPQEFSFIMRHYCQNQAVKSSINDFFSSIELFLFAKQESTYAEFNNITEQAIMLLKKIDTEK